jgi:hypothetical protein
MRRPDLDPDYLACRAAEEPDRVPARPILGLVLVAEGAGLIAAIVAVALGVHPILAIVAVAATIVATTLVLLR